MPIYEYRRPDGTTFEIMQSFSDEALTRDPETGVKVQRVLHAPAVHFKGSGFYNTDYGTRRRQRENAASEGAAADGASSEGASASTSTDGSRDAANGKGSSSPAKGAGSETKPSGSKSKPAGSEGKASAKSKRNEPVGA